MFIGAVPREVIGQILDTVPCGEWGSVFVGCSGSFRFDQAVKRRHPALRVYSNDVSLLTCGVGALVKGREFDIRFKDELAWMEEHLRDVGFRARVAAVWVAAAMAKFRGKNAFAQVHYAHYRRHFDSFWDDAKLKLARLIEGLAIEEFYAGDFLEQIARARAAGGGFACFAPTYKGGYERVYKFLEQNIEWPRPEYGVWDPAKLGGLVGELEAAGLRYVVISDQLLAGRQPATAFYGANKPVYTYTDTRRASLRRRSDRAETFRYEPLDVARLRPESVCEVVPIDNAKLTFLKQVYLAKGIDTTTGTLNFAVLIDGMLAGAFSYVLEKWGDKSSAVYLLSDFATVRERRVSKLIPMIAGSRELIRLVDRKFIIRVKDLWTTAFTNKPVSMKYRGVFEIHSRKPGQIQYRGSVREQRVQEVYREWYTKHGQRGGAAHGAAQARDAHRPREAARAQVP